MTFAIFLLVIFSGLIHALWNLEAKRHRGDVKLMTISQFVSAIVFAPIVFLYYRPEFFGLEQIKYVILTAFIQAAYTGLLSIAYRRADISVVYPIARGSNVGLCALIGFIILNDPFSLGTGVAVAMIGLGTLAIGIRKAPDVELSKNIGIAIAIGVLLAGSAFIDRFAVRTMPPFFYMWCMALGGGIISIGYSKLRLRDLKSMRDFRFARAAFMIGPCAVISYTMILVALQTSTFSYVVATREVAVVFGSILGIWLLREPVYLGKLLGIACIVGGLVMLGLLR